MGFTRASPVGHSQPWAGRAGTCPGAYPGTVACPDLPPAGFCSWKWLQLCWMGPGPASTKGWRHIQGDSWDCTSLACVLQGLGREEYVDPSWFAEALFTPSLTFFACQA